jgi:hypothetical protein
MRLTLFFSILALLVATLAFPAGQSCVPESARPAAAAASCCAGQCQCARQCACVRVPPAESSEPTSLAPATNSSPFLLAATLVARVPASLDAHRTADILTTDDGPAPLAGAVRSLSNRAPPLS